MLYLRTQMLHRSTPLRQMGAQVLHRSTRFDNKWELKCSIREPKCCTGVLVGDHAEAFGKMRQDESSLRLPTALVPVTGLGKWGSKLGYRVSLSWQPQSQRITKAKQ